MSKQESKQSDTEEEAEEEEFGNEQFQRYAERMDSRYAEGTGRRTREGLRKLQRFLEEKLGQDPQTVDVTALSEDDMDWFLDWLGNQGLSDLSTSDVWSVNKGFLSWYDNDDAVEDVDTDHLSSSTLMEQHLVDGVRWLTKEEHKSMIEGCNSLREQLICELLWETGVRRSEASTIQISDVTRDERKIRIPNAKNDQVREVYYSITLERTLREWLDKGGRAQYSRAAESDYLICSNQSEQVQGKYINDVVVRVAERAGIQEVITQDAAGRDLNRITAHAYRHSYAIHRVRNGMPIHFLKELMGHKRIKSTEFYLNFRGEDIKEANRKYRPRI